MQESRNYGACVQALLDRTEAAIQAAAAAHWDQVLARLEERQALMAEAEIAMTIYPSRDERESQRALEMLGRIAELEEALRGRIQEAQSECKLAIERSGVVRNTLTAYGKSLSGEMHGEARFVDRQR